MRHPHPLDFRRILARLGQEAGILAPDHRNPRLGQFLRQQDRRPLAVDPHRPRQHDQRGQKCLDRAQGYGVPHMGQNLRRKLGTFGKQRDRGIPVQQRKTLQHRIARQVRPANVQKPAQRVRQRQHRHLLTGLRKNRRQSFALGPARLAGHGIGMHHRPTHRRPRLAGPNPVDEIRDRTQGYATTFKRFLNLLNLVCRMQPWVIADNPRRQMLGNPRARLHIRPRHRGEVPQVDLPLDLRAIAPVDKDPRHIWQHHAEPGRAGKSGQPLQPLIPCGNIFALMCVGPRHDVARQPLRRQHRPKRRQPPRPLCGRCHGLKGLKHAVRPLSVS